MKSVVIIEDNALVRELIVSCLAHLHVRVRTAASAEEGLDLIRRNGKPDLVLCDIVLPQRSGAELIQHLRAHPATRGLPVIAVTVLADANATTRLHSAGFSDVIAKPIDPEKFSTQVARWLQ